MRASELEGSALALLRQPQFLRLWATRLTGTGANQMLMVALGWQMYDLTGSAWDLGLVGLAQFLPALLLTLPAGHFADRHDRRLLVMGALAVQLGVGLVLAVASWQQFVGRELILALSVVLGAMRAFQMPAQQALLPSVVRPDELARATALASSGLQAAIIAGPALGGGLYAVGDAATVYGASAALFVASLACMAGLLPRTVERLREPATWATLWAGVHFIRRQPVMLGAMSLDLFAVLLGGATALLPILARDILGAGLEALGLLRAAPAVGALAMSVVLAHRPLQRRVGRWLLAASQPVLNDFLALGLAGWRALRHVLFALFAQGGAAQAHAEALLVPQTAAEMALPLRIGDYTDFYTSIHHALNIGKLFGIPEVSPNFRWLPIAYHGRASSVVVSGTPVRRPMGQVKPPGADAPGYGPCHWLDYELELGLVVGTGNALGTRVPVGEADEHLFGICLLNDWSARDIQGWEMAPLGPFQAKNFATSVSPWIVTLDALAPYRCAWTREAGEPQPLAYLDAPPVREHGAFDIRLQVWLESAARRERGLGPVRLTETSFRHQYWTPAQMLAHHTVGGCNLQPGDLLGSGTISGPAPSEAGAMMELTQAGRLPLQLEGADGAIETRGFLEDGDAVIFRGWCESPGRARIGFGECRGLVMPCDG